PAFAHIPMILGPDRHRLSKRHGATSVLAFRDEGFLPEAMVNYLARLGWAHGDQEVFSREELTQLFDLRQVGQTPAIFDRAKLEWLNQVWLKRLADDPGERSGWRRRGSARSWSASGSPRRRRPSSEAR